MYSFKKTKFQLEVGKYELLVVYGLSIGSRAR
jgi:hypothetical protein